MCQDSIYAPYQDASKLSLLLALQHQGGVETNLLPTQVEKCAVLFHTSAPLQSLISIFVLPPDRSFLSILCIGV